MDSGKLNIPTKPIPTAETSSKHLPVQQKSSGKEK